tara:strand:+ start:228 stop:479 length:252 start_codon:yes stop_codon:yes gene_type:complete
MLDLNVNNASILMDSQVKSSKKVTRYRVTIDFTVNNTNCMPPSNWNWRELLELNDNVNERVKELYVENLGEIACTNVNAEEAY